MNPDETPADVIRSEAGDLPQFSFEPPPAELMAFRDVTLRDYLAAEAITECIRVAADQTIREPKLSVLFDKAAGYAYAVADSMLKARLA